MFWYLGEGNTFEGGISLIIGSLTEPLDIHKNDQNFLVNCLTY